PLPLLRGYLEERDGRRDPRVVHEADDLRELGLDAGDGLAHRLLVADVDPEAEGGDAVLLGDLRRDALAGPLVEIDHRDGPAVLCESMCGRAADAARGCGPGDDRRGGGGEIGCRVGRERHRAASLQWNVWSAQIVHNI